MSSASKQYKWRAKRIQTLFGIPNNKTEKHTEVLNSHNDFESFASFQIHEQNYSRNNNGKK